MRAAAITLTVLFAALLFPATAHADDQSCHVAVLDQTTAQVLDIPRVEASVTATNNATGMDVYVRAYQQLPDGVDGETWWKRAYTEMCPSWAGPQGDRPKPNIAVIMFSMEPNGNVKRQSLIKYGDNMTRIDGKIDGIRGRTMGNALREADSAPDGIKREGFTVAMDDTLAALAQAYNHVETPFDWAPLWTWVGRIFAGIATAVAAVFSFLGLRRWRNTILGKRRARSEAQRRYDAALRDASDRVLNTDLAAAFLRADAAVPNIDSGFDIPDGNPLQALITDYSSQFKDLGDLPAPKTTEDLNARADQYEGIAEGIFDALNNAERRADDLETLAAKCSVDSKRADLTTAQTALHDAISEVSNLAAWMDTGVPFNLAQRADARIVTALREVDTLNRRDVDTLITDTEGMIARLNSVRDAARTITTRLNTLVSSVESAYAKYAAPVDDVTEDVRKKAHTALGKVADDSRRYRDTVLNSIIIVPVDHIERELTRIGGNLTKALSPARAQIAAAEAERKRIAEKKRRAQEEADRRDRERRDRERREEDERRRRSDSSSFGYGYGAGYASGGGFSSGGFDRGGFGGGSSGSW